MNKIITPQMEIWSREFGKEYTDRTLRTVEELNAFYKSRFGQTRTGLNNEFLEGMDRSIRILEVGANVGIQLMCLQEMGFTQLYGIELQQYAIEISKTRTKHINLIRGTIFDIPFKRNFFDLVFTSDVLIHIHPDDISEALNQIYLCTRKYIWGFEYYSDNYEEIPYRGYKKLLWKTHFAKLYLDQFLHLTLVKEKKMKDFNSKNIDSMFLLKKI